MAERAAPQSGRRCGHLRLASQLHPCAPGAYYPETVMPISRPMTRATNRAFQDPYAAPYSHCFGCGSLDPLGHALKSYGDGDETVAGLLARSEYSGGVPKQVYGGLIASLPDCHGAASAAAFACRASGIEMADSRDSMRFVTASLKVAFIARPRTGTFARPERCWRFV